MRNLIGVRLERMLTANLGGTSGLEGPFTPGLRGALESVRESLQGMVAAEEGNFANTFRRPEPRMVQELARRLAGSFEDFVLVGIGGSTWGTIAIQAALCHTEWNSLSKKRGSAPRFHFLDNSDPDAMSDLLDRVDPRRALVNVVSKSGTTAETAANFMALRARFEGALGKEWNRRFVLTTDAGEGLLQRIAAEHSIDVLEIPPATGGRFSLLAAVGLFPAAMLGLDVSRLLEGAEAITVDALERPLEQNRLLNAASMSWQWFRRGASTNVLMPYSRALRFVANWYVQLWGESLGKRLDREGNVCHTGTTPLGALGAADQHSLLQLFMEGPADKLITFVRVEEFKRPRPIPEIFGEHPEIAYLGGHDMAELIKAEQESTAEALRREGRGSRTLVLPRIDEYWLGQLFQFLMLETYVNGELSNIDTFDQPGVEAGKLLTYGAMGREGYEAPEVAELEGLNFG